MKRQRLTAAPLASLLAALATYALQLAVFAALPFLVVALAGLIAYRLLRRRGPGRQPSGTATLGWTPRARARVGSRAGGPGATAEGPDAGPGPTAEGPYAEGPYAEEPGADEPAAGPAAPGREPQPPAG